MKARNGFVSNSSSSSFILNRGMLSEHHIWQIKHHIEEAERLYKDTLNKDLAWAHPGDAWEIDECKDVIKLYTDMDNFDMDAFLRAINIPYGAVIEYERD